MLDKITHIVHTMMTSLKDIRNVQEVRFIGNEAVRFRLHDRTFDVRGNYPLFSVHEIEGSCMCGSKAARDVEAQMNSGGVDGEEDFGHNSSDEALNDLLCAHVESMEEEAVRRYNEECGGPDLDPINSQRTWLKTHFLHIGHNTPDLLETVLMMEGRERRDELANAVKEKIWSD
ncbi:hypothetical protein pEaSNUABM3_00266 [Erwinia phage pEa_SNUABM_3]|uniref:Uncharacterized protein n=1 Tax=Erwinia phage pEa_SNUABM_3 TaxID=2869552 RepID=A0AAE7XJ18_9CAUD|nr:hypothetical protein MPK68_gp266 [Erwinia phage pEa_SNUABM_3]QZE56463.1 hypothetical protein pEaSNUABM3_00266 [Erwinia phage pEa_SNUABM_3]